MQSELHVAIDGHYYSAPMQLAGTVLEARITTEMVELLHGGERVALHPRSPIKGGRTTVKEHLPENYQAQMQWSAERLIHWGQSIGLSTGEYVTRIMERAQHPEVGYRASLGRILLSRAYGSARLENACTLALQLGLFTGGHVAEILKNGRDKAALSGASEWSNPHTANVRGSSYYS